MRNIVSRSSIGVPVSKLTHGVTGLGDAADIRNIAKVTQRGLDALPTDTARGNNLAAMIHNAGGDSEITLRLFISAVMRRIQQLNNEDGGTRKLREDFCFIGLDL